MVDGSMSRPDSFDSPENDEPLFSFNDSSQESDVASLALKLAQLGTGGSPDLALDLILNEIVEQARLATTATGAAIALFRANELICRATSGSSAPDLGVRLSTRTGLSGGCVRTCQVQRCNDAQDDPRVDGAAFRNLDVRSILVVPIIRGEELAGIFEIFSPRLHAFGDREALTLEALSRRIVRNLASASDQPEPEAAPIPDTVMEAAPVMEPEIAPPSPQPPDYWTNVLTAIVIGLALLLGWMVGYAGWQKATAPRSVATLPPGAADPAPVVLPKQDSSAPPAAREKAPAPESGDHAKAGSASAPAGGLVVYEKGRIVFEIPPDRTAASSVKSAGGSDLAPVKIAPEVAAIYLRHHVEAEYPATAQQSQVLGPVVLEVFVGKDGSVREADLVRGDPLLEAAALSAVRQWKYEPYSPEGTPLDFSTEVTVNFKGQ
jgi:TonB family protein